MNLWIECEGQVALSGWRVRLLETIEETGSISAAAERLGVQYRLAWERVDEMERVLGERLVERHAGGLRGGGARLTEAGRDQVARFRRFAEGIEEGLRRQFDGVYGRSPAPPLPPPGR
jgi:molybdate transport system regulatory protein